EETEARIRMAPHFASDTGTLPAQTTVSKSLSIGLDMYIVYREEFHSGWILLLGTGEILRLTPDQKKQIPFMTFDKKAASFFSTDVLVEEQEAGGTAKARKATKRTRSSRNQTKIPLRFKTPRQTKRIRSARSRIRRGQEPLRRPKPTKPSFRHHLG
ncbi:hypothetical protein L914_00131, partial [Phytophthora nicotianae]